MMAYLWHDSKTGGHSGQEMYDQYFALVCEYTNTPVEIIPTEERVERARKMLDPYRADAHGAKLFGVDMNLFTKEDLIAAISMQEKNKKKDVPF